jgi:electron transfer flavoprotein beta subunit
MKIVVCIKQISHVYARTGTDPSERFLNPEDTISMINPFDEVALEMALRIRESIGGGEVCLVTLGPILVEKALRRCLGMGADRLVRIEADPPLDPWRKSFFLTRAIREIGARLILCGKESLDTGSGQVGSYIAHRMDLPFISAVISATLKSGGEEVEAERRAGRGMREVVACGLPAVLSVDMGLELRWPKYEDMERARSVPIEQLTYGGEESDSNRVICRALLPPRPRPKKVFTPDSSLGAFRRIEQLLMGSRVEKKGSLLTGSLESQVEEIVSFLKTHGFIGKKRG